MACYGANRPPPRLEYRYCKFQNATVATEQNPRRWIIKRSLEEASIGWFHHRLKTTSPPVVTICQRERIVQVDPQRRQTRQGLPKPAHGSDHRSSLDVVVHEPEHHHRQAQHIGDPQRNPSKQPREDTKTPVRTCRRASPTFAWSAQERSLNPKGASANP